MEGRFKIISYQNRAQLWAWGLGEQREAIILCTGLNNNFFCCRSPKDYERHGCNNCPAIGFLPQEIQFKGWREPGKLCLRKK